MLSRIRDKVPPLSVTFGWTRCAAFVLGSERNRSTGRSVNHAVVICTTQLTPPSYRLRLKQELELTRNQGRQSVRRDQCISRDTAINMQLHGRSCSTIAPLHDDCLKAPLSHGRCHLHFCDLRPRTHRAPIMPHTLPPEPTTDLPSRTSQESPPRAGRSAPLADLTSPANLEAYKVAALPEAVYYIPNFITRAEEEKLLASIPPQKWISLSRRRLQAWPSQLTSKNILIAQPLPDWLTVPVLTRLQPLDLFSDDDDINTIKNSINNSNNADHGSSISSQRQGPNHVLVNEYEPGQGIFPHADGPAYTPCVATISLADSIVLDIYDPPAPLDSSNNANNQNGEPSARTHRPLRTRLVQEPRSCLVTTRLAYEATQHGIAEVSVDCGLDAGSVANWPLLDEATRARITDHGGRLIRTRTRTSLTVRRVRRTSAVAGRLLGFKTR